MCKKKVALSVSLCVPVRCDTQRKGTNSREALQHLNTCTNGVVLELLESSRGILFVFTNIANKTMLTVLFNSLYLVEGV